MKRPISFISILLLLITALAGCINNDNQAAGKDNEKISVITTIFAPYDFVREVAGDKADITMLLKPGSESHSYEPSPQDIITIQNCDVFIYVGGESEKWVDKILLSMDTGRMRIITLMDCVEVVEEETVEGMEEEKGKESTAYDEHVWTSPKNAMLIVEKISAVLAEIDAANALFYQENAVAYLAKLKDLDVAFKAVTDGAERKTIVFGDRFPFRYFADAYGLDYYAAFPGCSAETEPSAATVAFLIEKIKAEHIPVVFHIELSNQKLAKTISEETGVKVLLLHSCHNISKADFENGVTYLDLMKKNVDALREALR